MFTFSEPHILQKYGLGFEKFRNIPICFDASTLLSKWSCNRHPNRFFGLFEESWMKSGSPKKKNKKSSNNAWPKNSHGFDPYSSADRLPTAASPELPPYWSPPNWRHRYSHRGAAMFAMGWNRKVTYRGNETFDPTVFQDLHIVLRKDSDFGPFSAKTIIFSAIY